MIYAPLVMPEVITGLSLLLFFVAVGLCLYLDRRRAKKEARQAAATGASADRGTSAEALRSMGSTAHED